MIKQGFIRSDAEYCVYFKNRNSVKTIIIVWVDDLIIAGSNLTAINDIKLSLSNKFNMKDFGRISEFLGIEFDFKDECVKLHQSKYIEKILCKFKMSDCNSKSIPCDTSVSKIDFEQSEPFENNRLQNPML